MRLERRFRDGTPVVVLYRQKRTMHQPLQQFEPVGTGGHLAFHQLRLRTLRKERGLTQEDMAFRAGMSVSGYRRVETGPRGGVRLATLERLAWVLNVNIRDLL